TAGLPGSTGVSGLVNRTAARLRRAGTTVALLDLTALGQNLTPEQWYQGLLELLALRLDLEDELEEFWEEHASLAPLQRWMRALREVVLPQLGLRPQALGLREATVKPAEGTPDPRPKAQGLTPPRLVIFIDEIDCVRSLPFST